MTLLAAAPAFAKPRLGGGVAVATEGFFSTTLAEVKIALVQPGSAWENAGLQVGDVIIEMGGNPIKAASGPVLEERLGGVRSGDRVRMKVQRLGTGVLEIEIIAG